MENVPDNLPKKPNMSFVAIAQALAGMGARAVTLNSVARIAPASAREIHNEIIRKT
jgi:hypothetical protein